MKRNHRIALVVAFLTAIASAFAIANAAATTGMTITLKAPSAVAPAGTLVLSGVTTPAGAHVDLWGWKNATCSGPRDSWWHHGSSDGETGVYAHTVTAPTTPGVYSYKAEIYSNQAWSSCVAVNVGIQPSLWTHPDHSFVCYSKWQIDPMAVPVEDVAGLLSQGYWVPWAVAGNVVGGTNVGAYHLACNLTAGQAETGTYVDHDGVVYGTNLGGVPGVYPLAG